MIVIGVQECRYRPGVKDPSPDLEDDDDETQVPGDLKTAKSASRFEKVRDSSGTLFDNMLADHLREADFVLVKKGVLMQMRLLLFAKKSMKNVFQDLRVSTEATGLMHLYGGVLTSRRHSGINSLTTDR